MASETTTAVVSAGLSGLVGAYLGDNLFTTIIPTLIGVALHVDRRRLQYVLTLGDFVRIPIVACCVGLWGGPWMAGMAPESELAAPFMCFLSAYFAPDFLRAAHHFVMDKLGGSDDEAP